MDGQPVRPLTRFRIGSALAALALLMTTATPSLAGESPASPPPDGDPPDSFQEVVERFEADRDRSGAIQRLEYLTEQPGTAPRVHFKLAVLSMQVGNYDRAAQAWRSYMDADERSQGAAFARRQLEQIDKLRRMADQDPRELEQLEYQAALRGISQARQAGNPRDIQFWLDRIDQMSDPGWRAHAKAARAMMEFDDFRSACSLLETTLERIPSTQRDELDDLQTRCETNHRHRRLIESARKAFDRQDFDSAAEEFAEAFSIRPDHLEYGPEMVQSLTRAGHYDHALRIIERIEDTGAFDPVLVTSMRKHAEQMSKARAEAAQQRQREPDEASFPGGVARLKDSIEQKKEDVDATYTQVAADARDREREIARLQDEIPRKRQRVRSLRSDIREARQSLDEMQEECSQTTTSSTAVGVACVGAGATSGAVITKMERDVEQLVREIEQAEERLRELGATVP